ncbi:MAG TPA: tetratricopeptide repeat protein [Alphaproteobacteria bacterium]|nr:tetratricopeptide repeat protein [Alphaproteobacteria bacterium]
MHFRTLASLAAAAAILLGAISTAADQKDPRLDPLFQQLQASAGLQEAQLLEAQIWLIWTEAKDGPTDTLMQLGLAAMQSGNLAGALELFDAVTMQKPDFSEGWNKRATVLYMLGAYDRSAEDVGKVLELEPRHFGALAGLGLINTELDKTDEAIDAFERALKIHPHLPGVKQRLEALKKKKRDGAI